MCIRDRPPICHRDLKSPNVLLTEDPRGRLLAKVSDFGLSRPLGVVRSLSREKGQGDGLDNCLWQAPEIISHAPFNHSVDVYAFAIIMWELQQRDRPFKQIPWMTQIADLILEGGRPEITAPCPYPEWISLMQRCWSQNPKSRPSFKTVCSVLQHIASDDTSL